MNKHLMCRKDFFQGMFTSCKFKIMSNMLDKGNEQKIKS